MFVPQHGTAGSSPGSVQRAIDRADCVLAIITATASPMVQHELRYALEQGKLVIPIVRTDLADHPLWAQFPRIRIFTFSPWDKPGAAERQIVEFLKAWQVTKEKQQTIGALTGIAVADCGG